MGNYLQGIRTDFLIIGLDRLIERNLKLKPDVFIFFIGQYVKSVANFVRIIIHKRTEESVPDRKHITEVAVRPRPFIVMMEFMHVGRNEDITEGFIQPRRQVDVGMGEVGKKYRQYPVEEIE